MLKIEKNLAFSVYLFFLCNSYTMGCPVRLYVEIIHELKRVDYLTYRWTNIV